MLIRYEPLAALRQLRNEMDQAFSTASPVVGREGSPAGGWSPPVDIREDGEGFVISADLPGVALGDIEVTLDGGTLTIKGDRQTESENVNEHAYRRVERVRGSFLRKFSLPDSADAEKVSARGKEGVLEVTIPKKATLTPRRIPIAA